jgi:hypothetical protein
MPLPLHLGHWLRSELRWIFVPVPWHSEHLPLPSHLGQEVLRGMFILNAPLRYLASLSAFVSASDASAPASPLGDAAYEVCALIIHLKEMREQLIDEDFE